MPDVFTRAKRADVMSKIRGRGNLTTEMRLIAAMRLLGIKGWRRHMRLPGRPDFVFPHAKLAVFVDGCFWHRCAKHYTAPKNRAEFWAAKIAGNVRRDKLVTLALKRRGWRVIRIWEHALKGPNTFRSVSRIRHALAVGLH